MLARGGWLELFLLARTDQEARSTLPPPAGVRRGWSSPGGSDDRSAWSLICAGTFLHPCDKKMIKGPIKNCNTFQNEQGRKEKISYFSEWLAITNKGIYKWYFMKHWLMAAPSVVRINKWNLESIPIQSQGHQNMILAHGYLSIKQKKWIPVNEVVLLEGVQHDRDPSTEQTRQSGIRKPLTIMVMVWKHWERWGGVLVCLRKLGCTCCI